MAENHASEKLFVCRANGGGTFSTQEPSAPHPAAEKADLADKTDVICGHGRKSFTGEQDRQLGAIPVGELTVGVTKVRFSTFLFFQGLRTDARRLDGRWIRWMVATLCGRDLYIKDREIAIFRE